MHFKSIENENKEIVITGDFNCNMLNNQSNNNADTRLLLDIMDIYINYVNISTCQPELLLKQKH